METGDITHVLLSHLHFDHYVGRVRRTPNGRFEAAFPKARVFVQKGGLDVARGTANERLRAAHGTWRSAWHRRRPTGGRDR